MADQQTTKQKPTHDILHVRGEGDKSYWTKIGAAWVHEDGQGLNLSLDFIPAAANGRLVIRVRKDKPVAITDTATEAAQSQGEAA